MGLVRRPTEKKKRILYKLYIYIYKLVRKFKFKKKEEVVKFEIKKKNSL